MTATMKFCAFGALLLAFCLLPAAAYAPPVLIMSQAVQLLPALGGLLPGLLAALPLAQAFGAGGHPATRLAFGAFALAVAGLAACAWTWSAWMVEAEQDKHRNMVRIYDHQARWSYAAGPKASVAEQAASPAALPPADVARLAFDREALFVHVRWPHDEPYLMRVNYSAGMPTVDYGDADAVRALASRSGRRIVLLDQDGAMAHAMAEALLPQLPDIGFLVGGYEALERGVVSPDATEAALRYHDLAALYPPAAAPAGEDFLVVITPFPKADVRGPIHSPGGTRFVAWQDILFNPAFDPALLAPTDRAVLLMLDYYPGFTAYVRAVLAHRGVPVRYLAEWYDERLGDTPGFYYTPAYPNRDRILSIAEAHDLTVLAEHGRVLFLDFRPAAVFERDLGRRVGSLNVPVAEWPWPRVLDTLDRLPKGTRLVGVIHDHSTATHAHWVGWEAWRRGLAWVGIDTRPEAASYAHDLTYTEYNTQRLVTVMRPVPPVDAVLGRDAAEAVRADALRAAQSATGLAPWLFLALLGAATRLLLVPGEALAQRLIGRARRGRWPALPLLGALAVSLGVVLAAWAGFQDLVRLLEAQALFADAVDPRGYPLLAPEPGFVLPRIAGVLAMLQMLALRRPSAAWVAVAVALGAATGWMTVDASTALLYGLLGFLLACLAVQAVAMAARRAAPAGVVPLDSPAASGIAATKARNLGLALAAGLPVSPGFFLTEAFLGRLVAGDPAAARALRRSARPLGRALIVRSCARDEDRGAESGRFESLRCAPADLVATARAVAGQFPPGAERGVLVQAFVAAEAYGVMASQDAQRPIRMAVEGGAHGDVTAGRAGVTCALLDRQTGALVDGAVPAGADAAALWRLCRGLEGVLAAPVALEWAVRRGRAVLLQAHVDHTRPVADALETERAQLARALGARFCDTASAALDTGDTPLGLDLFADSYGANALVAFGRVVLLGASRDPSRRHARRVVAGIPGVVSAAERWWKTARHLRLEGMSADELRDLLRDSAAHARTVEAPFGIAVANAAASFPDLDVSTLDYPGRMSQMLCREAVRAGDRAAFDAAFGHRALRDYDVACPRFEEAPDWPFPPAERQAAPHFDLLIAKDDVRHAAARRYAFLRRLILEIGRRHGLGELVFQCRLAELLDGAPPPPAALLERQRVWRDLRAVPLPQFVTAEHLNDEFWWWTVRQSVGLPPPVPAVATAGRLLCLNLEAALEAPALVVDSPADVAAADAAGTLAGHIVVAAAAFPELGQHLDRVLAIVCLGGGHLSHLAVACRVAGVPCVFGTPAGFAGARSGELLRLMQDGRLERSVRPSGGAAPNT